MAIPTGRVRWAIGLTALLVVGWLPGAGQDPLPSAGRYKVTVKDAKQVVAVESALPVDPTQRIRYQPQGLGVQVTDEQGRQLHLSHFPTLSVDGQMVQAGGFGGFVPNGGAPAGGRYEKTNEALGKGAGGKMRHGFQTVYIHNNELRVTFTCEVVPTKAEVKAGKRRCDSVLLRYLLENKGQKEHKVGLRIYMDVYVITNDGALFAAPTHPGKILDGMELKDKMLPDYLQLLEQPDLKNPGFVAHLTTNLGGGLEKPQRIVLTRHGIGFNMWDMQAVQAGGDSALGVFWEPATLKPGGKREFAYGYGQGIVPPVEGEGQYELKHSGSLEPGKLFTLAALVSDPAPGQVLTLQLPEGVEAVEGRATQPVPQAVGDQANSVVMWKARITHPGTFPIQVRSSSGLTQTKVITVEKLP
jgi:hypothetical protein